MAGDITRITLNVLNFYNSETIDSMSNEEVGQYVRLMCKSILLGKECSLPDDIEALARYALTTKKKLSPRVLQQYPLIETEFGTRRRNRVLYSEWLKVCDKSEKARESVENRKDRPLKNLAGTPDESVKPAYDRITDDSRSSGARLSNKTEQNRTEQDRTPQSSPISASVGDLLDEHTAENGQSATNGRGSGVPGFFRRGQYPGTSPKDVWKHCAKAWTRLRGGGAYCRFPTKHPSAKTDTWADLVDVTSSDLIVPAFELWIDKEGKFLDTQYPLSEFLKGSTVAKYLAMVSPLNEVKPKITDEDVKRTYEIAKAAHAEQWGLNDPKPEESKEPGVEGF